MKGMKHEESKETPEYEAKSHSKKFLKKAVALSERKMGGKKSSKKKHTKKAAARKR